MILYIGLYICDFTIVTSAGRAWHVTEILFLYRIVTAVGRPCDVPSRHIVVREIGLQWGILISKTLSIFYNNLILYT